MAAKSATIALLGAAKNRIGSVLTKKIVEESTEGLVGFEAKNAAKFSERLGIHYSEAIGTSAPKMDDSTIREVAELVERNAAGKSVSKLAADEKYIMRSGVDDQFRNAMLKKGASEEAAEKTAIFIKKHLLKILRLQLRVLRIFLLKKEK